VDVPHLSGKRAKANVFLRPRIACRDASGKHPEGVGSNDQIMKPKDLRAGTDCQSRSDRPGRLVAAEIDLFAPMTKPGILTALPPY